VFEELKEDSLYQMDIQTQNDPSETQVLVPVVPWVPFHSGSFCLVYFRSKYEKIWLI
jgi:hypothetical protein